MVYAAKYQKKEIIDIKWWILNHSLYIKTSDWVKFYLKLLDLTFVSKPSKSQLNSMLKEFRGLKK